MTAIIALPLLIVIIQFSGPFWFTLFTSLIAAVALYEFYHMGFADKRRPERFLAIAYGAFLVPLCALQQVYALQAGLVFAMLLFGLIFLWRFNDLQHVVQQLALLLFGFIYVPLLLGHLVLLRALPFGREWIYLVLLIVMASDTGAYFSGITLGRHKLYPAISPNKSIEGSIGGLLGGLAAAFIASYTFFPMLDSVDCLALGLGLGAMSQLGDLFESMVKRACGVKDSGTVIPGHGGILDRLDSLLFAFPLAFYYGFFLFSR
ncbi:phosphatidate cytidylyltransferase [Syntrophotalea acetylenivorans]|uniref:phosphatidate cytidylyltransferase n=1 Tax=Syntrophotalea acetylenivorans TaxID=1842532 RepID=UPI000B05F877|nr:phosphatidate cytidylyltransferase [Syntrophotalea acetylenivorans]